MALRVQKVRMYENFLGKGVRITILFATQTFWAIEKYLKTNTRITDFHQYSSPQYKNVFTKDLRLYFEILIAFSPHNLGFSKLNLYPLAPCHLYRV